VSGGYFVQNLLAILIWGIRSLWNTPSHPCQAEIKDCILYDKGQKKNRWLHLSWHLKQKTQELSCVSSAIPLADYLKPISMHKFLNNKQNSPSIIEKLVFVILVNHTSLVCLTTVKSVIASQALQYHDVGSNKKLGSPQEFYSRKWNQKKSAAKHNR